MEPIEFEAEIDKETKNTIRYAEITEQSPPKVRTVYIQKWALPNEPPEKIRVTIEESREETDE